MCFDHDSLPPIAPIAGGALDSTLVTLTAADGTPFAAFRARPVTPTGAGVVILPDVRGLYPFYEELALRFAERGVDALTIDWFGRTAGVGRRGADFDAMTHASATTWAGISADIGAAVDALRHEGVGSIFTIGFCMGGRMSFLANGLGLDLAGVIGLYGTLVGPWRNDSPEPVASVSGFTAPVLGLFGETDPSIPSEHIDAFESALTDAGVAHRLITYAGAPHSFFDRKFEEHATASSAAWDEITAFIGAHTAAA
jgi:carboxymethylenebutenolidase